MMRTNSLFYLFYQNKLEQLVSSEGHQMIWSLAPEVYFAQFLIGINALHSFADLFSSYIHAWAGRRVVGVEEPYS